MKRFVPVIAPIVLAWARRHERRLHRTGRPLTTAEQALAESVGVTDVQRVRVAEVERLPLPAARLLARLAVLVRAPSPDHVDAMTLGHGIYLRGRATFAPELAATRRLFAHELRHVQQVEAAGSLAAFLRAYLWQVARHGYADAPFEADAREAAERAVF